ncbi:MAG: hypothetical protein HYV63_15320 [Candidatus Schekmanbacteria bacterium]|nr:hypothetical protein [Candidatus Schekmanbacteria bacterium]
MSDRALSLEMHRWPAAVWLAGIGLAVFAGISGCASRHAIQVVRAFEVPNGVEPPLGPVVLVPLVLPDGATVSMDESLDPWRVQIGEAMRDELREARGLFVLPADVIASRLRGYVKMTGALPLVATEQEALAVARRARSSALFIGELRRRYTGGTTAARLELAISLIEVHTGETLLRAEGRIEAEPGFAVLGLDESVPVPRDLLRRLVKEIFKKGIFPLFRGPL